MSNLTHSRRSFLYGSALVAGSAILAACSSNGGGDDGPQGSRDPMAQRGRSARAGSATKPLPVPANFQDSPALKGLPPVKDRLPDSPLVLPHNWVERGKYGGNLNLSVFGTTGMASAATNYRYFYGFSPARFLNDSLDIGPGTADRWSSNADATVWTIHFRDGLKWSDGHPFSVDDVLFWYEDIAMPGHDAQTVPADCLSSRGNPCRMTKVDDNTVRLTYDSPQPLLPTFLAWFVKGGIGQNGPSWVFPKHYLKQFHPKYNKSVPKDWDAVGGLWEQKADWLRNPDCPTLTGFRCRSWDNSKGAVLERNPYYYVVTKDGDQLPYLDTVTFTLNQSAETIKLNVQQGKVDFCHGPNNQIGLSDVSALSRTKGSGKYEIVYWDSGSGTGPIFFLNLDYVDKKYRDLFNDKRFRQAISHGFDRKTVNKTVFFGTGVLTTGTAGTKQTEYFAAPKGPQAYKAWRDSYKSFDVQKAKQLLAELGLKDGDNDGYVEFPDGSKLEIDMPYAADESSDYSTSDDRLVADMKKIGLRMTRRPVPPNGFETDWEAGKLMSHTNWEASGPATLLGNPSWLVPIEPQRWAPMQGQWYVQASTGKDKEELGTDPWKRTPPRREPEAGGPIARMIGLYRQTRGEADQMKRNQLVWQILQIHTSEGPFFMGSTSDYQQVMIHNNDLRNVPGRDDLSQHGLVNTAGCPCPAAYEPESWFWSDPSQHS
ncbi:MAG TPA: ABC transporter substrate-binding protein [Mycobacteriales bacterium]|nr:ABC transporter substrate-binding protein [Mycobacteriales bacterium]